MSTYALIRNNEIVQVGSLPRIWVDPDGETHDWRKTPFRAQPADLGWLPLVEEPRPADTPTTTWERADPAFVNGVPTVTWTERPKTAEELAAEQANVNANTISNRFLDTDLPAMLDIIGQTNADLRADPAQELKAIARAVRRAIRKTDGILDAAD